MKDKLNVSKILVKNGDNFLSVKKKSSDEKFGGKWELPGGKLKESENFIDAGKRELKEETNLNALKLEKLVRVEIEKKEIVNCWILYTENYTNDIKLDKKELENYKWLSKEEFMDCDWHRDAGYALPSMYYLEDYLNM